MSVLLTYTVDWCKPLKGSFFDIIDLHNIKRGDGMNSKLLLKKAITSGVALTLIATYSLVALANSGKVVGELIVNGSSAIGEGPFVTVNGDPAKNGRSVFSASTIQTPAEF